MALYVCVHCYLMQLTNKWHAHTRALTDVHSTFLSAHTKNISAYFKQKNKSVSTWKRGHNRIVNLPNIWYGNCYINGIAIDEKKRNIFWILVHLFIGIRRKIWQYLLLKPSCVRPGMDQPIPCVSRSNAQCSTAQGQKPIFFFFYFSFLASKFIWPYCAAKIKDICCGANINTRKRKVIDREGIFGIHMNK